MYFILCNAMSHFLFIVQLWHQFAQNCELVVKD